VVFSAILARGMSTTWISWPFSSQRSCSRRSRSSPATGERGASGECLAAERIDPHVLAVGPARGDRQARERERGSVGPRHDLHHVFVVGDPSSGAGGGGDGRTIERRDHRVDRRGSISTSSACTFTIRASVALAHGFPHALGPVARRVRGLDHREPMRSRASAIARSAVATGHLRHERGLVGRARACARRAGDPRLRRGVFGGGGRRRVGRG
jgi:hypothetical protein